MKENTKIDEFMTASPHCINSGLPLKMARELMHKYGVRHLPVQNGGHLVGVISDRDLKLAESFDPDGNMHVDDAMTPDPFSVRPGSRLADVAEEMAMHKYGCAVVQDSEGKVVGIFTAIDGLRALSDSLNTRARKAAEAKQSKKSAPARKAKPKPKAKARGKGKVQSKSKGARK